MTAAEQQIEVEMAVHQLLKDARFIAGTPVEMLVAERNDLWEAREWLQCALEKIERHQNRKAKAA